MIGRRTWWLIVGLALAAGGCAFGLRVGVQSDGERLREQARQEYEQGQFRRAADTYRTILRREENDLIARYNLACTLARAGEADGALTELERAVTGGLSDRGMIERDEDLRALRESPRFAATLRLADRILAEQSERSRFLVPPGLGADERVPLIVFLHGHLGRPEDVVQTFAQLVEVQRVALLVPAGGQVFRKPCGTEVYAWLGHDLDRIVAEVRARIGQGHVDPERVFVAGFSGGATMALRLGLTRPALFKGVVALAGHLTEAWFARFSEQGPPPVRIPVVLIHGAADRAVPVSATRRAAELLERAGYRVQVQVFPGGHYFPTDLPSRLSQALTWFAEAGD